MEEFNKIDLIRYFTTDNQSGRKTREKHVRENFIGLIELINEYHIEHFSEEFPYTQKLYNYLHDIVEIPVCTVCGGMIKWRGVISEGYLANCSNSCRLKNKEIREKINKTNDVKYSVKTV